MQLSERIAQIKPSATIAVNTRATELRAAGYDIINLSVGEPDFDTPEYINQAAIAAIHKGFTKYTAVDGLPELKEAIINKFKRDNNLHYSPNQILVSVGVKQGFYNLTQSLLNRGDEVIIPAPYWVSYPEMVLLAEAKPVIIESGIRQNFKITPEQLKAAITPKTRLFILNSPSNPTGKAYNKAELQALGKILQNHPEIIIAADDIYEYIYWGDGEFANIINACPELYEQTVVFNGVSKSYAMTGWRIGYAAGPEPIIKAMKKIQSQCTSCANSIAQKASAVALNGDRAILQPMIQAFKRRHDLVYHALRQMKNIDVLPADGTFYLFPNVEKVIKKLGLKDDIALAEHILNEAKVAMVPGTAFGAPGYIRLSYATHEENLKKALQRLNDLFN